MSRAARSYSQSGIYHILFRGINQQNIFEEKADYEKFIEITANVKSQMEFEIYTCCLMNNQVHIVIKEECKKRNIINHEKDIYRICKMI